MTGHTTPRIVAASSFRPGFCPENARRRILFAAILASALGFIDGTVVSIAMPAMRSSLEATLAEAQWINNAYLLSLSALMLVGGAAGDRFGLGRVFSIGIAVFIVASLASALAPNAETLIAARALKGIGAAAMIPGSLALIYRTYPKDERGRAIGLWAGASALTTALGPILGGAAITLLGDEAWRWLFAINLPLGLIAIWFVLSAVEDDRGDPSRGVDYLGAFLISLCLGMAAYALTGLGAETGTGAYVFGFLALMALGGFIIWEARVRDPMMPLSLFASLRFTSANLATFLLYLSLSAVLFFLPMTVIAGWGITEAEASAAFLPLTGFIALFSARVGRAADRIGPGILIAMGTAIVAAAFAGMALTAPMQAFWKATLPLMCLMGAGMCLVVAPLSTAVMGAVPEEQAGAASGINNAVSRIAGLVAIAAMGAVAASAYASAGGPDSFGAPSDLQGHADAMNAGFVAVAWVTAALAAAASLISWIGIRGRDQAG